MTVEHWTTRSGPRIRYLDNAPAAPRGLPILFSPGFSDIAEEYLEVLEFFAPRRLLVVEVRGRGRTEAPEIGYAAEDHVADLAAVLDEEGIDRFHLMTFSRGTTWGLGLALARREQVASISIADYRAVEVGLPPGFAETQREGRFRGKVMTERLPFRVIEEVAAASRSRDLWDDLAALPVPVLLARPGTDRGLLDDAAVERYRAARPDLELVIVPDARHDVFRPDPHFYPKAVASLLDRIDP